MSHRSSTHAVAADNTKGLDVAHMQDLGVTDVVSYDRDVDRIGGIIRVEP